jgi:hypothetical protein
MTFEYSVSKWKIGIYFDNDDMFVMNDDVKLPSVTDLYNILITYYSLPRDLINVIAIFLLPRAMCKLCMSFDEITSIYCRDYSGYTFDNKSLECELYSPVLKILHDQGYKNRLEQLKILSDLWTYYIPVCSSCRRLCGWNYW